jgi:hypothetical protein
MCPPASESKEDYTKLKAAVGFLSLSTVGLLAATIALAVQGNSESSAAAATSSGDFSSSKSASLFFESEDANVCAGAKLALDNMLCADMDVPPPQGTLLITLLN